MPNPFAVDQLDEAIDALLARGESTPAAKDPEFRGLLAVAAALETLPNPDFKLRLKADLLEAAQTVTDSAHGDSMRQARIFAKKGKAFATTRPDILPTLFRTGYGAYPVHRGSFMTSALAQEEELVLKKVAVFPFTVASREPLESLGEKVRQDILERLKADALPSWLHGAAYRIALRARRDAAIRRAHDPAGDGMFQAEYRVPGREGQIRWLSARSETFFEGEGSERRPVRTIGAVLDVTDRSQGNANGMGILDFTTRRVFDKFSFEHTYPNGLTSTVPMSVKILPPTLSMQTSTPRPPVSDLIRSRRSSSP